MQLGRDWNHYSYRYGDDGRLAEVRFDVERAVMPSPPTHQTCRRMLLRGADAAALAIFEAELPELLAGIDCILVGVLRYPNTEELVFQVEDVPGFSARHEHLAGRAPVAVEFQDSPKWEFFNDRITPGDADWRRIGDRESVARLLSRGADGGTLHDLQHCFIGNTDALDFIRTRLVVEGFRLDAQQGDRMLLMRPQRLDAAEISAVTVPLARFARSKGVLYDGWRRLD